MIKKSNTEKIILGIDPGTNVQRTVRCYRKIELPLEFESRSERERITRAAIKKAIGFSVKGSRESNVWKRARQTMGRTGGVYSVSLMEV